MPLHDTDGLIVETATAAESLPDPTLHAGRTHDLTNTGTVTAVWSSIGATPFVENGANVATVSVARGQTKRVHSNGTRWSVEPYGSNRRVFAGTGVTDANGNLTFTFTPPFAVVPVVTNSVQTALADATECRITALSTSSVTFNARRAPSVVVLGISVLSVPVPAAGVTVHAIAREPGQV